jgi:hypothetical protein
VLITSITQRSPLLRVVLFFLHIRQGIFLIGFKSRLQGILKRYEGRLVFPHCESLQEQSYNGRPVLTLRRGFTNRCKRLVSVRLAALLFADNASGMVLHCAKMGYCQQGTVTKKLLRNIWDTVPNRPSRSPLRPTNFLRSLSRLSFAALWRRIQNSLLHLLPESVDVL